MSIKDQINADLKEAIKSQNNARRDALRGLMAAIRQVEVDKQKDVSDDDVVAILQKEAKNRNETIDAFTQGGRPEDAEQERLELTIIEQYLPE
ncbi:MAG: GatB/YqeY domain-containing protein, partial [Chloroflexi bacterium]|nr:GatB/YqeY domain-containing protein [Chloroflexota bacterium]